MQKQVRWLLFTLFFLFCFALALFITFPTKVLKPSVVYFLESQLGAQSINFVNPPQVAIGDLSLWWPPGVKVKKLSLRQGNNGDRPLTPIDIDALGIRPTWLSLLTSDKTFNFAGNLFDGSIDGSLSLTPDRRLTHFSVDIADLVLKKLPHNFPLEGIPLEGQLTLETELDFGKNPAQDGAGTLTFETKKLALGPGTLALQAMPSGFGIPRVNLGDCVGDIEFVKGKGKSRKMQCKGGDIEAELNFTLDLNQDVGRSRMDGTGWFKIGEAFLKANPGIKTLFDLVPELKAARESDGRYSFTVRGNLAKPDFRLKPSTQSANSRILLP